MPKHIISFAKIVSPPSATAWAQTYHAGNVYAVVSVMQPGAKLENPEHALPSVHVLGKDIINNLEAEYFAIATKNLQSIKEAVSNTCKDIPDTVSATVIFAVITHHILYIFSYGNGFVYLKREEKFASIVSQQEGKQVIAVSGFIQPSDMLIMATDQFMKTVSHEELIKQLVHSPSEIAESFSSKFDDEQYAGTAAIIFLVEGNAEDETKITKDPEEEKTPVIPFIPVEKKLDLDEKTHIEEDATPLQRAKSKKKLPAISLRQMVFLSIAVLLAVLLIGSIVITKHKQQYSQTQALFASKFPSAKQQFDEGQSLLSLNKNLAHDDFSKAKISLEDLKTQLPANSQEEKQVTDLLGQINQSLGSTSEDQSISLKPVDTTASKLLAAEITTSGSNYFTQDASGVYSLDENVVANTDSTNKTLIKNNTDWSTIGGFGNYLGNFYVLDKKTNQIIKFSKSADGYSKANYFTTTTPDLSHAVFLAIDGSIWILFDNGSIQKFTKGTQDQFSMQELTPPLAHPTRIFTTDSMDNLYILDDGNNRIVVIKKDGGNLVAQYTAKELKNGKDIDVDEKNKKIFTLIANKIFEIDMK